MHHEYHPWARIFKEYGLKIDQSNADDISHIGIYASNAFDESKQQKWFLKQKGDLVFSERTQQRWYRETEKLLEPVIEHFTRSFSCNLDDISLNIGSNALLCEDESENSFIMRYSKGEPSKIQMYKWSVESFITACNDILLISMQNQKLTKLEHIKSLDVQPYLMNLIYNFFHFIIQNADIQGCYIIHKLKGGKEVKIQSVDLNVLPQLGLEQSYQERVKHLETVIGFRQTLSTNPQIVENGRKLLESASKRKEEHLNSALCLERIADSYILPLLLQNRYKSLIVSEMNVAEKIPLSYFDSAINFYKKSLEQFIVKPDIFLKSVHQKLATVKFAKAIVIQLQEGEILAKEAMSDSEYIDKDFKFEVLLWRFSNSKKLSFDLSTKLYDEILKIAETEEDKKKAKYSLTYILETQAKISEENLKYEDSIEKYSTLKKTFMELGENENASKTIANIASVRRRLASLISNKNQNKFTIEEEGQLFKAEKDYEEAIDLLKTKSSLKDELIVNLASSYCSLLIRNVQSPPLDRCSLKDIKEKSKDYIEKSKKLLLSIPKTNEVSRHIAAINSWNAKYITDIELPNENDPDKQVKLRNESISLYKKAQEFFISDIYPVDFIVITVSLSNIYISNGKLNDAMKMLLKCLSVLSPTTVALRKTNIIRPKKQEPIENLKPLIIQYLQRILKEMLLEKSKNKQDCEIEKCLYRKSLSCTANDITNQLFEIKKLFKQKNICQ